VNTVWKTLHQMLRFVIKPLENACDFVGQTIFSAISLIVRNASVQWIVGVTNLVKQTVGAGFVVVRM